MQMDEDDFKEEQNFVARLIQMLYNDNPEEMLKVFLSLLLVDSFVLSSKIYMWMIRFSLGF